MDSCTVYGCTNVGDPSVHYYVFPKHPTIIKQWLEVCGWPTEHIDIKNAKICSLHFDEDSYAAEVKITDFEDCYSKILKFDAVPTLHLPNQILLDVLEPQNELLVVHVEATPAEPHEKYNVIQTRADYQAWISTNKNLRQHVENNEGNCNILKRELQKEVNRFKAINAELSAIKESYAISKKSFMSLCEQKNLLSKVFSESQIKILSGKRKIYWSNDDMVVGYTIRHLSNKRCYQFLSKNLNFPLPAVSSIKRWINLKSTSVKKRKAALESAIKQEEPESD